MTLNQLRYFCTASRCHSITKAAEELYVTQPTVSVAIRDLEIEFGISLFYRKGNSLILTQEGEELYNKATYILQYCTELQADYSSMARVKPPLRIGIPPMLELAKQLNCKKQIVLGYKDELFLNEEFEKYGTVTIATEDGSCGTKGNVLDAVKAHNIKGDVIYACGPMPMLRAIKAYALENNIECYISLEEKMACGIGACLACVCKSKDIDDHSKVHNKRVCKEGPVFNAKEVEI